MEAAEGKLNEDLELARHRRDKLREAGEEQRRQAHERSRRLRKKEMQAAAVNNNVEPSGMNLQRWQTKANPGQFESCFKEPVAANNDLSRSGDGTALGTIPSAIPSGREVDQLDALEAQTEEARSDTPHGVSRVLSKIHFKHHKEERFEQLQCLHACRKSQERFVRLREVRRREFEARPQTEQLALRKAFNSAALTNSDSLNNKELWKALEEMGLTPKTDTEKKEVRLICNEVCVAGDIDFFAFCLEAAPRTREKLREMRRNPLLQTFKMCDIDHSGLLSIEECRQLWRKQYAWSLDDKGLRLMSDAFEATLTRSLNPELGEVDFEGFETLMAETQEHYQRILKEREADIMREEGLTQEDVEEHWDELVSLYDSFTRGNFCGGAGMDMDELRVLLIEYGLYPHSQSDQEYVADFFDEVDGDGDGSLDFQQFLIVIRKVRELSRLNQQSELQRLFKQFDRDGSGLLEMTEVFTLLGELGLMPKCREDQQDMKRILDGIDTNGNGDVSFREFQTLVQRSAERTKAAQRQRERRSAEKLHYADAEVAELRDAFHALDTEGKGILPIIKLRKVLDLVRNQMSAESLQAIVERMDPEGVGGLVFEQFLYFLKEVLHPDDFGRGEVLVDST